jgi:alpha-galactosidase
MSELPDGMAEMYSDTVVAVSLKEPLAAGELPSDAAWSAAPPVRFSTDWQGQNEDSQRETEVRLLWSRRSLYLRFDAKFRTITVFPDADEDGRRDQLWNRDVCEAFLQPDPSQPRRYAELEVAPNGFWIDLDIGPDGNSDLRRGLRRQVKIDRGRKSWSAVLEVPMQCLTPKFDPTALWRCNFYRVEGESEPRFYSAWQPTRTEKPNFHVPEAFGRLLFVGGPDGLPPEPAK